MMKYIYCQLSKSTYKRMNLNEIESRAAIQYRDSLYRVRRIYKNADQDLLLDILLSVAADYIINRRTDEGIIRTIKPYLEDTSRKIDELLMNGIIREQRMYDGHCHKSEYCFDEGELAHYVLSKKDDFRKEIR